MSRGARVLVDGYNLLGVLRPDLGSRADALESARAFLIARLQGLPTPRGETYVVVFDGRSGLGRSAKRREGAIEIIFSDESEKADDLVLRLVRGERDRSRLLVVTSDRELAGEARRLGARTVSSEEFARRLAERREGTARAPKAGAAAPAAAESEKPPAPSRREVDEWEREFRERESREGGERKPGA